MTFEYIIPVPTYVMLPTKNKQFEKIILNLNTYRNTSPLKLAKMKRYFHNQFLPMIYRCKKQYEPILKKYEGIRKSYSLTYTINAKNNRQFDVSNLCSIIDKFACDSLVKEGILPDDSWKHLKQVLYKFGSVTGKRTCFLRVLVHIKD